MVEQFHLENLRLIRSLNNSLRYGVSIISLKPQLEQIPRPILVDYNNVLFGNFDDSNIPNPFAREILSSLQQIGTVLIITAGSDWDRCMKTMYQNGLWNHPLGLICEDSYKFDISRDSEVIPDIAKIRSDFRDHARRQGFFPSDQKYVDELQNSSMTTGGSGSKKVAFAFGNRAQEIPLIDDALIAVRDNLGIKGILVEPFFGPYEQNIITSPEYSPDSLFNAVEVVRNHYKNS